MVKLNNALLQHISKTDHNFNFNAAKMLVCIHNKFLKLVQFHFVGLLITGVFSMFHLSRKIDLKQRQYIQY